MTERLECDESGLVFKRHANGGVSFDIFDAEHWQGNAAEGMEIARRLVTCWNAHDTMLEALEECLPLLEKLEDETLVGDEGCLWPVEKARAAIALATKGEQL